MTDEGQSSYAVVMAVSVADVAAALRLRHPGLPIVKLHKLLYYCQGHHLATFGRPLFDDVISAWDLGPVVGSLWYAEKKNGPGGSPGGLGVAELNTIGYVISRYGALTGRDLIHLTHSEDPWRLADAGRPAHTSVRIEPSWIEQYFRAAERDDSDDGIVLDAAAVREWLGGAEQRGDAAPTDDAAELSRRITDLRARVRRNG